VELTQAANTLIKREHGFFALNTDFQAVIESMAANLAKPGQSLDLHRKLVLVLGAGGIARSVVHAIHRAGATVYIANRTPERAEKLAGEISAESLDWNARHKEGCEIVFNCTPVGMHPNIDDSPIHPSYLKPGMVIFDTVYTPETTMLVREARTRGCQTVTGVDLFVRQAALQFRQFTGKDAPTDLMFQVVRRALSPVTLHDDEV
jgi:3-dehydroquinate dehydratase/shikimate dehydrogenase